MKIKCVKPSLNRIEYSWTEKENKNVPNDLIYKFLIHFYNFSESTAENFSNE